mmetsp:Transcript_29852/g.55821  ORF Transcript_29852/g.55821 Transcript_29852/m.55821 type:complete len:228 (-) Transcript_29852:262-945(-)
MYVSNSIAATCTGVAHYDTPLLRCTLRPLSRSKIVARPPEQIDHRQADLLERELEESVHELKVDDKIQRLDQEAVVRVVVLLSRLVVLLPIHPEVEHSIEGGVGEVTYVHVPHTQPALLVVPVVEEVAEHQGRGVIQDVIEQILEVQLHRRVQHEVHNPHQHARSPDIRRQAVHDAVARPQEVVAVRGRIRRDVQIHRARDVSRKNRPEDPMEPQVLRVIVSNVNQR